MTFRDDHDAALARADALEDEVERTRRERDELVAKVAALEAEKAAPPNKSKAEPEPTKKPKKRAASSSDSSDSSGDTRGEKRAVVFAVGLTVLLFGVFALMGGMRSCDHKKEHAAWEAKRDARKAHEARWRALAAVEPCVRRVAWGTMSVRGSTPDKVDPRLTSRYYNPGSATVDCWSGATKLLADPQTPQPMKTALGQWIDLQGAIKRAAKPADDYYSNQDWKEDNFAAAPKLWQPLLALLDRQPAMFEALRKDVLPAIRSEMRGYIAEQERASGRDELYWRTALTVAMYELVDRGYAAAGIYAGKDPDLEAAAKALAQPTQQFLELVKQAPIEIRRDLRKLEWITNQLAAGTAPQGETPLWHLQNDEDQLLRRGTRDWIPALPPDPGKEPEEPAGD